MSKRIICLLLAFILMGTMSSCTFPFKRTPPKELPDPSEENEGEAEEAHAGMRKTVIYFVDGQNLLVPITCNIPWVEGIARETLGYLVSTPDRALELSAVGLNPSLPEGSRVLGLSIRDGKAKVDFSSEFLSSGNKKEEKNAIDSVVYTLTEFPTVDTVQIFVEGKAIPTGPHGNILQDVLSREKINLELEESNCPDSAIPTTLYFRNMGSGSYYTPVTRMVDPGENPIKTALEELIKGPANDMGLMPILPAQTKVLGVDTFGSEVVVDFSKDLEYYGGGMEIEKALIDSVVLTVSQFEGVEKVSIQVEGEAVVLPEGTPLDMPILKPQYINPGSI